MHDKAWIDAARNDNHRTTAQLSAAERSEQMDRTVAQVVSLTKANNALNAKLDTANKEHEALLQWVVKLANEQADIARRLNAIERATTSRWRWLLTGK